MQKRETIDQLLDRLQADGLSIEDSRYCEYDYGWTAEHLLKAVKSQGCRRETLDLTQIDFHIKPFTSDWLHHHMDHVRRVAETDTKHPIIVSPYGSVLDGYHRIIKRLIIERKTTIPCYRLKEMPPHDQMFENGEWKAV